MNSAASQPFVNTSQQDVNQVPYGYRQPVVPIKFEDCCPTCQADMSNNPTILTRLRSAALQLVVAVMIIVVSVLRLARLVVAGAFTLVGLIGTGMYIAGQYIIHPDDRRLLPNLPKTDRGQGNHV